MAPEPIMQGMTGVKIPHRDDIAEITRSSRDLPPAHYTYKIENFSQFSWAKLDNVESGDFEVDSYKWTLMVYPKGNSTEEGKSLSMYLAMEDCETLPSGRTTYALYMLRVRDQLFGKHVEKEANCHFSNSIKDWGHLNFMPLDDINALSKGYLVNDTLAVEVQIHGITVAKEFS
ncbi:hypothetical protein SADUNF_Sadunf03G0073400 [Salix dunnii]|uniref:MATH domain-containing protein n=1 Tax=Salix dunnii TaxID=1413687 RepID=A0A835KHF1_9ROSI|nr:hypothetical protein SADUNF_Sadunf03G0073400 [Salix dunnii]